MLFFVCVTILLSFFKAQDDFPQAKNEWKKGGLKKPCSNHFFYPQTQNTTDNPMVECARTI